MNKNKPLDRDQKIEFLQGLKSGKVTLKEFAPEVKLCVIDWGHEKVLSFTGINLTEEFIKVQIEKEAPGSTLFAFECSPSYAGCVAVMPNNSGHEQN